jgi:hypothetical protein
MGKLPRTTNAQCNFALSVNHQKSSPWPAEPPGDVLSVLIGEVVHDSGDCRLGSESIEALILFDKPLRQSASGGLIQNDVRS